MVRTKMLQFNQIKKNKIKIHFFFVKGNEHHNKDKEKKCLNI